MGRDGGGARSSWTRPPRRDGRFSTTAALDSPFPGKRDYPQRRRGPTRRLPGDNARTLRGLALTRSVFPSAGEMPQARRWHGVVCSGLQRGWTGAGQQACTSVSVPGRVCPVGREADPRPDGAVSLRERVRSRACNKPASPSAPVAHFTRQRDARGFKRQAGLPRTSVKKVVFLKTYKIQLANHGLWLAGQYCSRSAPTFLGAFGFCPFDMSVFLPAGQLSSGASSRPASFLHPGLDCKSSHSFFLFFFFSFLFWFKMVLEEKKVLIWLQCWCCAETLRGGCTSPSSSLPPPDPEHVLAACSKSKAYLKK